MGVGPVPARVMIVGEAYGAEEELRGEPFLGASGQELNRMLTEAGLARAQCFTTNVVNARPPKNDLSAWIAGTKKEITPAHIPVRDKWVLPIVDAGIHSLEREIALVKPNIIIALGNTALWALTGEWGIMKWRGSILFHSSGTKVIPTYHPAAVLRQWEWRAIAVNDLRRAERHSHEWEDHPPEKFYEIAPSYDTAYQRLDWLIEKVSLGEIEWIDFDLETRAGHIDCAGFSWSKSEAICIPFMSRRSPVGYWEDPAMEGIIVWMIYRLLTHPKVKVRGQNLLYDCQYTYRHWHFVPRVAQDTMLSHHSMFPGTKKSLDYLASMYCERYTQWKPDKVVWKEGG